MKKLEVVFMAVAALSLSSPAYAFLDQIVGETVKSATESLAKGAIESAAKGVAANPSTQAGMDCKRGQMVNPYFIMLKANQLPDADLADQACVSGSQLKKLTELYIKQAIIK